MPVNYEAPIEIRDGRNGNWFWVDKEIWSDERLTSSDKVVYGTLAYYANQKNQSAFPSIASLQNNCKLSKRQIYISIKKLENIHHIKVDRKYGKPNQYTLLDNGINHLKSTSAKYAPVHYKEKTMVYSALEGVQNKETNKSSLNKKDINININRSKTDKRNPLVNLTIEEFKTMTGFTPTDRKPRNEAMNLVKSMNTALKRKLGDVPEERLEKALRYYFKWIADKDWASGIQTMSTVRRKLPVFLAELKI